MHDALVLVVDDKPSVREIVSRQLRKGRIRVETAGTADEALERVTRGDVALVVIDVALAHPREGLELADKLHGLDPELSTIFFTGDESSVEEYPYVPLVKKPHTERALVLAVRAELAKSCTHRLVRQTHDLIKAHVEDKTLHSPSLTDVISRDIKHPVVRLLLLVMGTMMLLVGSIGYAALKSSH